MKRDTKLIDADIKKRFKYEERFLKDYDSPKNPYKEFDMVSSIIMTAIVMSGVIYGLATALGWI